MKYKTCIALLIVSVLLNAFFIYKTRQQAQITFRESIYGLKAALSLLDGMDLPPDPRTASAIDMHPFMSTVTLLKENSGRTSALVALSPTVGRDLWKVRWVADELFLFLGPSHWDFYDNSDIFGENNMLRMYEERREALRELVMNQVDD